MKKLMVAIAGAVALTCSAFAGEKVMKTWFDAGVAAGFPNATTMTGGTWDDDAADKGEWTGSTVEICAEDADPLKFTATEPKLLTNKLEVIFNANVKFTPFTGETEEDLPQIPADAKAGVIVFQPEGSDAAYYVIESDSDGSNKQWHQVAPYEIAPSGKAVPVSIWVNGNDGVVVNAVYSIGGVEAASCTIERGTLSTVNFTGDGELSALSAECEADTVEFTIPTVADATNVTVTVAGQVVTAPYEGKPGAALVVTYKANEGKLFSSGSDTYVYNGTVAEGTIATGIDQQEIVDGKAKIGTTYYLTLAAAAAAAQDGATITLLANDTIGTVDINVNATLDFNGYTLTGTAKPLVVASDKTLNMQNGMLVYGGSGYGIKVCSNAVVNVNAGMVISLTQSVSNPMFDVYGGTVNVYADTFLTNTTYEIFRFKEANMDYVSHVNIYGGTIHHQGYAGVFQHYKPRHTATVNIYGGEITAIDAYNVTNGVFVYGPEGGAATCVYDCSLGADCNAKFSTNVGYINELMADGYVLAKDGDWFVVAEEEETEAKIGTTYYLTLAEALDAAQDGDTVTLVSDCSVNARINIDPTKSITLDANGKTITIAKDTYAFVYGGATETSGEGLFTVKGNGTFQIKDGEADANGIILWARRGDILVENGTFTMSGSGEVAYARNGSKITINGGTMKNLTTGGDVLNVENKESEVLDIQCYGGSYSKDPADGDDFKGPTFVAEGYGSYKDGELWTVAKLLAVTVADMPAAQVPEDLDAAFTYATEDTESAFTGGWKVDFYVSFDAAVKAGAVTLKGQYGEYPWTGAALPEMTAGVEVPLMQTAGNEVSVENLLAMKVFNCGVANVSAPSGTTMTVVLKMYKKATGESFDLATKAYTLESKIEPLDPTKNDEIECEDETQAAVLAAAITLDPASYVKAPAAVTNPEDAAAYPYMYQGRAYENYVFIELTDAAIETLEAQVSTNTVTETVAAALVNPEETEATISGTTAGFYYWIEGSDTPDFEDLVQAKAKMATATGESITLVKPEKIGTGGKQFYKVAVGTMDPNPEN